METGNKMVATRTEGRQGEEILFKVSVWNNETILEMDSGDGCISLSVYVMPLRCTLKMANFVMYTVPPELFNLVSISVKLPVHQQCK